MPGVITAASAQVAPSPPMERNSIGKNLETLRPGARGPEFGGGGANAEPLTPERKTGGGGAPAFTGGQQVIKPAAPGEALRLLQGAEEEDPGGAGGVSGQYTGGAGQPDTTDRTGGANATKSSDGKDDWPGSLGMDKPPDLEFQNEDWNAYLSDGEAGAPMSTTSGGTYGGAGGSDGGFKPTSTGGGVKPQQIPSGDGEASKPETSASQPGGRGSNASGKNSAVLLRPGEYVRQEVLAVDLSPEGVARVRALGFTASETLDGEAGDPAIITLTAPKGMDTLAALARLRKELPGKNFHPNRLYRLYRPSTKEESREQFMEGGQGKCAGDRCYARTAIGWNEGVARCARGQRIGIIDTEADLRHPAFAGQNITQKSFLPPGADASPSWHGTGILGLLAGRSDSATPGLIPEASFFTAGIFFADEDGGAVTSTVSLLRALDWLRISGAKLINMSFSGPGDDLLRTRIADMSRDGFIFVAAAGNEGPTADPSYPAAYPQVIAITAVTSKLQVYPAANRGSYIDLAAPGVRIWTAAPGAKQGYRSGTSFAAPFAIAVLALQRPETLQPPKERLLEQVRTVGIGSASGRNPIYGRGLLQAPRECPSAADAFTTSLTPTPSVPVPAKR